MPQIVLERLRKGQLSSREPAYMVGLLVGQSIYRFLALLTAVFQVAEQRFAGIHLWRQHTGRIQSSRVKGTGGTKHSTSPVTTRPVVTSTRSSRNIRRMRSRWSFLGSALSQVSPIDATKHRTGFQAFQLVGSESNSRWIRTCLFLYRGCDDYPSDGSRDLKTNRICQNISEKLAL